MTARFDHHTANDAAAAYNVLADRKVKDFRDPDAK